MISTRSAFASVTNTPTEPGVWPASGTTITLPSSKKSKPQRLAASTDVDKGNHPVLLAGESELRNDSYNIMDGIYFLGQE